MQFPDTRSKPLEIRDRCPYNMQHVYAIAIPLAGMPPPLCAVRLKRNIEMFLTTCVKWTDGEQNALEMARLESTLLRQILSRKAKQTPKRLFC
ncbi:hypothetical protein [Burkholderia sp. D-99]|uniref:hypothetical protein n=1 Tax=Burkholderia sp. D-99 TaxID=2717316 RepID=UPI001AA15C8D|nr:hypothetical protein [Burkholderia sp. D-99]